MDDLISRQAAIDALEEGFKDATEGVDKLSPTYGLIKAVTGIYKCLIGKLPSAQPENRTEERTKTHACDSISRQAAIDALNEVVKDHSITDFDAIASILDLPPAQPEQRTDLLKDEIKRMKRSFTICINRDYYTGYMSALSAVEGYIAQLEGANNDT